MEAVWNLEDKWKLSTKQVLLLFLFAASGVVGLCLATLKTALLRRLKSRKSTSSQELIIMEEDQDDDNNSNNRNSNEEWTPGACGWASIKTALMGSLRWSRASKWGEAGGSSSWRETPLPLLDKSVGRQLRHDQAAGTSWPSRSSDSPVWQRPILMGEKCELPRFSGLILYDENGQLLCDVARTETSSYKHITSSDDKEKNTVKAGRTTLRDLL